MMEQLNRKYHGTVTVGASAQEEQRREAEAAEAAKQAEVNSLLEHARQTRERLESERREQERAEQVGVGVGFD